MTDWSKKVKKALGDPRVLTGIAQVSVEWMDRHIAESVGRAADGSEISHKPLSSFGYRRGGHPLRNTGALARSLAANARISGAVIQIEMRGLHYGAYHDRGFKTKGPNFIPLTRRAVSGHSTGANPRHEGLIEGGDYLMAWRGVTVPARPFILPTNDDLTVLGKSIYLGLKAVLKGT